MEKYPKPEDNIESMQGWSVELTHRAEKICKALGSLVSWNMSIDSEQTFDEHFDEAAGYNRINESGFYNLDVVRDRDSVKQDFVETFSGAENGLRRDELRKALNYFRS